MDYIIYLIGFFLFLLIIIYGTCISTLLKIRMRHVDSKLSEREDEPPYLKEVYAPYENELSGLGFAFSHCFLVDTPWINKNSKKFISVFVNHEKRSYATLSTSNQPEVINTCNVEFITYFPDGHQLSTVNGISHTIIGSLPRVTMQDPYTESLEKQWQTHTEALVTLTHHQQPVLRSTPLEFISSYTQSINDYMDSLKAEGWIKETENNHYQLTIIAALRSAFKLLNGEKKLQILRKNKQTLLSKKGESLPLPVEVEVEGYNHMSHTSKGPGLGNAGKLFFLLITLALFAISFGFSFSLTSLLIVIAVISLHELGHFFGMYIFKYKDLKVFFLPFLGAATIGSGKDAKPYQKVIVYILGPLPGILLGLLLLSYYGMSNPLVNEITFMLLVINYLNLLPIMPLDGGQLFNLFFSRVPLVQNIFQVLCGFVLMAASTLLQNDPILFILGIFLIIGSVFQVSNMRILSHLRKKIRDETLDTQESSLLPEIFRLLRKKPYLQMTFAKKYQTVKYLLENSAITFPSIKLVITTACVYVFIFILPIIVVCGKVYVIARNNPLGVLPPLTINEPLTEENANLMKVMENSDENILSIKKE
ncbi:MAG: hypothetical protein ACMUJM_09705 [bacterium]